MSHAVNHLCVISTSRGGVQDGGREGVRPTPHPGYPVGGIEPAHQDRRGGRGGLDPMGMEPRAWSLSLPGGLATLYTQGDPAGVAWSPARPHMSLQTA